MKKFLGIIIAASAMLATFTAQARDQIHIVGSSTVFPFSTTVAEKFGNTTKFKAPVVESTGSGGGLKLFCAGLGTNTPDIANASRQIKSSEITKCKNNGVTSILEVKIGFDGIVFANAKTGKKLSLTTRDIFLALAKDIPVLGNGGGHIMVPNPNKTWKDVNPNLPDRKIEVLGPPPTSGTRDAFVELAMESGAKQFPNLEFLKRTDKKKFKAYAHTLREDGVYVEAGENDNLIIQKLKSNPNAFGIFGFSFLDNNSDVVQGSLVNGKEPTFENISTGDYPVSRSLFFYVKKQHIGTVYGIMEYVNEFTSSAASGEEGYLVDKGLIPILDDERKNMVTEIK